MPTPQTSEAPGVAAPEASKIKDQMKGSDMNNVTIFGGDRNSVTMSSREIADLCEKRHGHVLRDIEKMLGEITDLKSEASELEAEPKFGLSDLQSTYKDATGRSLKEYRLPRDLTVTLITGYRADLRYRVVKRLEQLESTGGFDIPNNLPDALRLAATQAEQIEAMKEDVAAHERLTKADGSLAITDAAKNLSIRPKDLFTWLSSNGWIYKRHGCAYWLGYQTRCNSGDLEHKSTTILKADGSEKITEQVRVTPKGLSKLAKLIIPAAEAAA